MKDHKRPVIIAAEGLDLESNDTISRCFEAQSQMRPRLGKSVGHTVLSFSKHDIPKLSNGLMARIAREYLRRMEIRDTQFLVVLHRDREHPHMHIVFNRVDNYGNAITDSNEKYRSAEVCRDITERENLYIAPGKKEVKRDRLREPDKSRYRIFDILQEELKRHCDFDKFIEAVERRGVECTLINRGKTSQVQGIRFKLGPYSFNGSKIDASCSYSRLLKSLEANRQQERLRQRQTVTQPRNAGSQQREDNFHSSDISLGLFQTNPASDFVPYEECAWYNRKRKKKKGPRL